MSGHLAADAIIVKFPAFESAVCKVLGNKETMLDDAEKESIISFQRVAEEDDENEDDLILMALKKSDSQSLYNDFSFIPPTSNVVERCFSLARYSLEY
jgi:hypothetical protein